MLAGIIFLLQASALYAEDYKIGAVNVIRIFEQSPQAERMRGQLEKEFAPRDRELISSQKSLKEMEDRLQTDAAIMSESERSRLERDIINKRRDLKRSQDEFREDFTFRRNEEYAKIQKEIVTAINEVAKANKYDIVLNEGAAIFVSPKVDISKAVIEHLKSKSGGASKAGGGN